MSETIFSFQARAQRSFRQLLDDKEAELSRAKRSLRLEAAKLKYQRERGWQALRELESLRETYRGKGASRAYWTAIVALHRAKRALGLSPEQPVPEAPIPQGEGDQGRDGGYRGYAPERRG